MYNKNREISLDVTNCPLNEGGVKEFWWPFHAEEMREAAKDAMHLYANIINQNDALGDEALNPYRLMGKNFVIELIALFQADTLFHRAAAENINLKIPPQMRVWSKVQKGNIPAVEDILRPLQQGPKKSNWLAKFKNPKRLFKILKKMKGSTPIGGLNLDGLKIAPRLSHDILKNNVIATQRLPLITSHAKEVDKDVYFQRSDKWFQAIENAEKQRAFTQSIPAIEEGILKEIEALYQKYNTPLPQKSAAYFKKLLNGGAALMRAHLQYLATTPAALPREVWTGSGGNIWDSILRVSVRAHGGKATGHDHATGSGHFKMPSVSFLDLWGCDSFMTYNAAKAQGIRDTTSDTPFLSNERPEILFPHHKASATEIKTFEKDLKNIKKIIFLSTPFDGDRGRATPNMPDVVRLDWQYRLMKYLSEAGYEVILKLHPECKIKPSAEIAALKNVSISLAPFEEMLEEGDVILFDYIFTSTFRSTLETNLPMVVIETVDFKLIPQARELLEKRTPLIPTTYDAQGRAQIKWQDLLDAIQDAPAKSNTHDFLETYLK